MPSCDTKKHYCSKNTVLCGKVVHYTQSHRFKSIFNVQCLSFGKKPCHDVTLSILWDLKNTQGLFLPPVLLPDSLMATWALLMLPITVPSGEVSSTSNVSSASSRWSWMISVCQLLFDTPIQTKSFLHPSLQCDFSFLCFCYLILSIHP